MPHTTRMPLQVQKNMEERSRKENFRGTSSPRQNWGKRSRPRWRAQLTVYRLLLPEPGNLHLISLAPCDFAHSQSLTRKTAACQERQAVKVAAINLLRWEGREAISSPRPAASNRGGPMSQRLGGQRPWPKSRGCHPTFLLKTKKCFSPSLIYLLFPQLNCCKKGWGLKPFEPFLFS